MKKKILMITVNDIDSIGSLGVTKKIKAQYKAFTRIGCDTYLLCLKNDKGILIHGNEEECLFSKQIKTYISYIKLFRMAEEICKKHSIDFCYIRYPLADWVFCKMIKRLHKISKVVVEIPTFPYDYDTKKETNIVAKFDYSQDKRNRNIINKYIDLIVNFHGYTQIYGTEALPIDNGVDVKSIEYIGDQISFTGDINMIGVALLINIHGYDRIIEGLKKYYDSNNCIRKVYFYIVGDGPEKNNLVDMVEKYNLGSYVFFMGIKSGKELDNVFKKCNLAVASLAAHRRGGKVTSELKVKEYCARGIPYIASSKDKSIPANSKFVKYFTANEEPINISDVIKYMETCNQNENLCQEMRNFAEKNCIWEKQCEKILDKIKQ